MELLAAALLHELADHVRNEKSTGQGWLDPHVDVAIPDNDMEVERVVLVVRVRLFVQVMEIRHCASRRATAKASRFELPRPRQYPRNLFHASLHGG